MDWNNCLNEGNVIKITSNKEKVTSLIKAAEKKINFVNKHKIDKDNSEILFTDMYEGCLEILHALAINLGYKVSNHICLGYLLRDVLNKRDLFLIFDNYRKIRNDILYYGKILDISFTITAIENLNSFHKEIFFFLK